MNYTTSMHNDEVKQNILKCSRCGLCQEVCPVFKEIKDEKTTARGKLMQIWGLKKGDLKLNSKILKNFDLCLNCDKCKLNCPSGVDTTGVFNKEKKLNLLGKFLNSIFVFNLKLSALSFFAFFKKTPIYEKKSNILYFEGCIAKKLKKEFKLQGIKLKNGNFECCALPYLTKGREDIYKKIVEYNENIIENAQMVVFDCATCFNAVKNYPFKNPKNEEKLVFYTDFYKQIEFIAKKNYKITYHLPCHLKSSGIELEEIENILKKIKNINYKRAENAEDCCGFGGDFFIRHPKIAYTISMKKAKNIINTNTDFVLTSCPTCLWSLQFSMFINKLINKNAKIPKVMDLNDFINKFCTVTLKKQSKTSQDAGKCELLL